jgi:exosortase
MTFLRSSESVAPARPVPVGFLLFSVLVLALFAPTIWRLYEFSSSAGSQHYSHFVLIPIVSGYFLFSDRKRIFQNVAGTPAWGVLLALAGTGFWLTGVVYGPGLSLNDHLALATAGLLLIWIGGFLFYQGGRAFRQGLFPLLFLVFLVPIPSVLLEGIIRTLQLASAEAAYLLFLVSGTPFLREGTYFSLPGLDIIVAPECGGIRSGLSLFITSIVAGQLLLRRGGSRLALAVSVFPIAVFKNGVRIVLLSLLAVHWDERIMHGALHTSGGIPFFGVSLGMLGMVLLFLRRKEHKPGDEQGRKLSAGRCA